MCHIQSLSPAKVKVSQAGVSIKGLTQSLYTKVFHSMLAQVQFHKRRINPQHPSYMNCGLFLETYTQFY